MRIVVVICNYCSTNPKGSICLLVKISRYRLLALRGTCKLIINLIQTTNTDASKNETLTKYCCNVGPNITATFGQFIMLVALFFYSGIPTLVDIYKAYDTSCSDRQSVP